MSEFQSVYFVEKLEPLSISHRLQRLFQICEYCRFDAMKRKFHGRCHPNVLWISSVNEKFKGELPRPVFIRFFFKANSNRAVCANLDTQFER